MHPLSPALIIAAASGVAGPDPGDSVPGAADAASTAAFVGHVGYWAHYDEETAVSTWPFPLDADCEALARLAAKDGILSTSEPAPGVIYLQWSRSDHAFRRAGIVIAAARTFERRGVPRCYHCLVLEGSALLTRAQEADARHRQRERLETAVQWVRRKRGWCTPSEGDRFISWVDLDGRKAA